MQLYPVLHLITDAIISTEGFPEIGDLVGLGWLRTGVVLFVIDTVGAFF